MSQNNPKGKRVERALANWMKDRGIHSARRSQQYSGNSSFGDSDIVADELPSFHIECKGTKHQKLGRSLLKEWWSQVHKDVKPGKLPVIFHIANGCEPVALVPSSVLTELKIQPHSIRFIEGASVTPMEHVGQCTIFSAYVSASWNTDTFHLSAFPMLTSGYLYIVDGEAFLELMKKYEPKLRVASTAA